MNKHTTAPAEPEQRDGPSLFVGITLEVEEIILCREKINIHARALRTSMDARHEAALKQAADDIAKISGQMHALSAHLASVISRHQLRNPKMPG